MSTPCCASTCRNMANVTVAAGGRAPGYVGYDEGGQLTEKVRRKPLQRAAARRDREGTPP